MQIPKDILERLVFKTSKEEGDDASQYPSLKTITHPMVPCEDCDLMVSDRRIDYKRNVKPIPHWKQTCRNCGMIQHPDTKEYTLDQNTYREVYFSPKKAKQPSLAVNRKQSAK